MSEDTPGQIPQEDVRSTEALSPPSSPPERIGRYRILQKIGEGGMGEVYLAEQDDPHRKVALKIIKPGMDSKQVLARFEAERQALALMDHPNVAKVFDAGADDRGRPYFAMEYVKGVRITEHCDRLRLTTDERLELFQQVCAGVQHAHQKGIIHRDIKPSNVLVQVSDGERVPKIIDFGVAKATAQRLTERTLFTELGQLIGTPEYMSPEQAEMTAEDIDTRTDVYSLGVLFYELLVGALPFDPGDLRRAGFDEIRRRIREDEPSRPSVRLSTLGETSTESAKRRGTDLRTLRRQLAGDLDWIALKALAKDRGRRYGSPAELSADIERHLTSQPVAAGPPSSVYRARKFAERHRVGVGVAVAAVLILLAFAVTMTIQTGRIARERDRANREAVVATQTSEFLENLFEVSNPDEARGSTVTARELLDRGAGQIRSTPFDDVEVQARLMGTMGRVYLKLGHYQQAEPLLKESRELRLSRLGDDNPETLRSMNSLAVVYLNLGRYDEAEPLLLESVENTKRVLGRDHPDTLSAMNSLAILYRNQGRYDEAEPLSLETLQIRKRVLGRSHPDTLGSMINLANVYWLQGRRDEVEPLYRESFETLKTVLGEDHPDTLSAMNNLAVLYFELRRYDDAERLHREIFEVRKRVLGDEHPDTLLSMYNLALVSYSRGDYDEAARLHFETLKARKRVLGDDHPNTLSSMTELALIYELLERYDEAEPLYLEALERQERVLGDDHPDTLDTKNGAAWFLLTREPAEERDLAAALRFAIEANESTGFDSPPFLDTLSLAYHLTGDTAKAIENQKMAIALLPEGDSPLRRSLEEALAKFETERASQAD